MPTPPDDPDQLVNQLASDAAYGALRDIANDLIGLLVHAQRAATDPAEIDALQADRLDVQARLLAIRPGTDAVEAALDEWGARVRALREP